MRKLVLGGAVVAAMVVAGGADAQMRGPGAGYPPPGVRPAPPSPGVAAPRWGSKVGGRWWGGANAPGGWGAYRRPVRGWALPTYWVAPRFYVSDWRGYGLPQPPAGYGWSRYYDDAVLVDGRGSVYDSVSGIDWDGGGYGYADDDADRGPRRDDGLGGAAVGAVAGGVAGNLIAGRGNRLGGTLIGAGVGAAAGYAIDRAEDDRRGRGRVPVAPYPPAHGAGYAPPPPPPPPHYVNGPGRWTSPDGATTVVTTSGGYYGGGTTTVTVQSQPVVTTTTTTTYEDAVTYRPAAYRTYKTYRKRWVAKPRCACR